MKVYTENMALMTALEVESFVIGKDNFGDLTISETRNGDFFYFKGKRGLIKYFVLDDRKTILYLAEITLIQNGENFTPRITFSIRDKNKKLVEEIKSGSLRSRVSMDECHENFWILISYLKSLSNITVPEHPFSMVSTTEKEKLKLIDAWSPDELKNLISNAIEKHILVLTDQEISLLLGRKEKLEIFDEKIKELVCDESFWQNFFEENTWIFGYGLKYVILKTEQSQPHYGGTEVHGRGGQKGDFLTASLGNVRFTTLVEIKTPCSKLLSGKDEIRNGAWSIGKDLTDAISQIFANKSTWEISGSRNPENMDALERDKDIYTCSPKGIIVIGSLSELRDSRTKRDTFERFRQSIAGIEIVTFDELLDRAKFIVSSE